MGDCTVGCFSLCFFALSFIYFYLSFHNHRKEDIEFYLTDITDYKDTYKGWFENSNVSVLPVEARSHPIKLEKKVEEEQSEVGIRIAMGLAYYTTDHKLREVPYKSKE